MQGVDLSDGPLVRIGGATIDPVSREASFAGGQERLQPQNLKVLVALARGRGRVVSRADLIDLCWDGRIVGEDVINHAISVLRTFAARAGGFTIETIPKAGYRLMEKEDPHHRAAKWRTEIGWAAAIAGAAALLVAAPAQKQGEPPVPTVALVSFGVPAGDPAAAEVARAARASLSHMLAEGGFPVRLANAGETGSDFVISGDIEHSSGKIQALVRMEETRDHQVIFTHRFDESEGAAGTLPEQIGASVAANLSWTAPLMILDRRHPTDPRITGELLRQLSITVEGGDMLRAYEISRQIVVKVPNSAIAQVALAFNTGFAVSDLPRDQRDAAVALGRRASDRARALAPEFGDVYIPWCILHSPVRRTECEARLRHGIRVDPDAPFPSAFLSSLLEEAGRFEEALQFARIAIADDPYKPAKLARMIRGLEVTGQTRDADAVYAQAVRWWPKNGRVSSARLMGLMERGDFAAIEKFAREKPSMPASVEQVAAAMRSHDAAPATGICKSGAEDPAIQMLCLLILANFGELDRAFALADQMYPRLVGRNARDEEMLWLEHPDSYPTGILLAPSAAALRRDRRFLALAKRVGLLDYWRTGGPPDFCRRNPEPICARILP
ncbi:MAG: winged helix-turn-helix domain-containing protein [Sphingomicrobium sp.]